MKITFELNGVKMVIKPEPGSYELSTRHDGRVSFSADLDELPRWEVIDGDQVE